jgi:hypothetical protein
VLFAAAMTCLAGLAQGQTVYINFQTAAAEVPEGYLPDSGAVFGDRGNGWSYGWDRDISADAREKNAAISPDKRWDTLMHLQKGADATWEIALENGPYNLYIVAGDAGYTDQTNCFNIEGVIIEDPDGQAGNWDELTATVTVADGRLTLTTAACASNAKICFIDIVQAIAPEAARAPSPANEATDVPRDLVVGWEPGEGVSSYDVYLGTNFEDVNTASRANPKDVLISQGQADLSLDVGRLEFGVTYYWRVDSVLTDGSIYKNEVWSFVVEPFAYPVQDIVGTVNAASDPGLGIENTINGSGMNDADQHSTESTDMWLVISNDPVVIEYAFDKIHKLHEMLVWNYNVQFEPILGFGLKDVTIEYSVDGETWTLLGDVEIAQATARDDYEANTVIDFGGAAVKMVRIAINDNYGELPQYGLSEVRFMSIPATAREPQPADGATNVSVGTALTWRAGREAASHDVSLGIDADALTVTDTVSEASFVPAGLDFGTTYYWKVDEVNEAEAISVWPGPVWSFMAQEYAVIDDFESYDDEENRIFDTWLDGYVNETGSTVGHFEAPFAETAIVNSGAQSMPMEYDNSVAPFYSEAEFDLGTLNLAANGADSLRLFFRGNPVDFLEQADGSMVVGGGGADIWNTADEFRYVYKSLSGDGEIVARVDSIVNTNDWAKVGVMIRETLEPGSRFAAVYATPGNGCRFQARQASNADAVSDSSVATAEQTAVTTPQWVKLVRSGDSFSGFYSADGATWTAMAWNPQDIIMGGNVYIGLAVTSHNASAQTSAAFSDIATTGSVSGSWQTQAIGVEMPSNDPDQLYVAVEDTSGNVAVVVHPDPAAAGAAGWTEWVIPLSDLAGINAARASILYVGVGDRDNPTAAGTGIMYIDDIGYGSPASDQ